MYNQPFRGNSPTPQQQHQMHQQQQLPNVSTAASMAQHQRMMASQGMRQPFLGPHFQPQHHMPPQLYPPNLQHHQQQMNQMHHQQHQQMNIQHSGLPPGHIGPMRPPQTMFPPMMGPQQHQQQGPVCPPGFPQQRFPQHPPMPPMRQPSLNPQLMPPQQHHMQQQQQHHMQQQQQHHMQQQHMQQQQHQQNLQQTSMINPSIFVTQQQHNPIIQKPPVPSPHPMSLPVLPQPLSRLTPPTQAPLPPAPPQIAPIAPPINVSYYDLPAGLMVPLVKPEDHNYKPIDPKLVKLPPPQAPSEKLLKAVESFYAPPSHERPRDADGWEHGALAEFFRIKQEAIKRAGKAKVFTETLKVEEEKKENIEMQDSPPKRRYKEEKSPERRKSSRRSKSGSPQSRSRSRRRRSSSSSSNDSRSSSGSSRSRSRSPPRKRSSDRHSNRHHNRRSGSNSSRQQSRKRSRSPDEFKPSFATSFEMKDRNSKLEETNKGAQLLLKMGWSGTGGLGSSEQGISEPVSETGSVRDSGNMYHGIGVREERSDAYESYRKSRGQAFLDRISRTRDEKS